MQDWDVGATRDSQQLDRELQVRICRRSPAVLRTHTKYVIILYHHGVVSRRDLPVSLNCKLAYNLPVVKQQGPMLHQTHGRSVWMGSTQLWQVTTGFLIRSRLEDVLVTFSFPQIPLTVCIMCSFWLPLWAPVAVSRTSTTGQYLQRSSHPVGPAPARCQSACSV